MLSYILPHNFPTCIYVCKTFIQQLGNILNNLLTISIHIYQKCEHIFQLLLILQLHEK